MNDRLHVCCGEVYLEGYHNVDAPVEGYSFLASERHDIVEANLTTVDKYYRYDFGKHPLRMCVADELVDMLEKEYPEGSFREVLMVSAFEHFGLKDARTLLRRFHSWLSDDGALLFDVPDIEASFESMRVDRRLENIYWHMRLIYGSQKNAYGFHKWGYTREMLQRELTEAGFAKTEFQGIVPHDYPMIGVKAWKGPEKPR